MPKANRIFFSLLVVAAAVLVTAKTALASEGIVELKSANDQSYRCYALSVFQTDNQYHLLTTCRGLVYPPSPEALHYLVWANAKVDGEIIGLGELGLRNSQDHTALLGGENSRGVET